MLCYACVHGVVRGSFFVSLLLCRDVVLVLCTIFADYVVVVNGSTGIRTDNDGEQG